MNAVNYIAKFVDNYGDNVWHRFVEGGLPTAALGILAVFGVLSILWGCLEIFRYVFYTLPEQRKNAAFDQSPSAFMLWGDLRRPTPVILYPISVRSTLAPKIRRVDKVILTYDADSSFEESTISLSPSVTERAIRSPVIY